jgi:hypothetical protein
MSGVLDYVVGQCGNSLDVVNQTIGFDALLELISSRDSELTPKQKHLIEEYQFKQLSEGEGIPF